MKLKIEKKLSKTVFFSKSLIFHYVLNINVFFAFIRIQQKGGHTLPPRVTTFLNTFLHILFNISLHDGLLLMIIIIRMVFLHLQYYDNIIYIIIIILLIFNRSKAKNNGRFLDNGLAGGSL